VLDGAKLEKVGDKGLRGSLRIDQAASVGG
jgi:hypothetical protein